MAFSFRVLDIPDLLLVVPEVFFDDRGSFCEIYRRSDFVLHGIDAYFVQDNHSHSSRGVLRGLHFQLPPHAQGKLIRVVSGKVWDVAVDIRPHSPSFGKWIGIELSDENSSMLWIPPGFAHGFVGLSDSVHVVYKCTKEYNRASEAGIRWDDADLGISWPLSDVRVSGKDRALPTLRDARLPQEG